MRFYFVIIAGVIAISMASILIKLCRAPGMIIALYRLGFAALFFIATSFVTRKAAVSLLCGRDLKWAAVSGIFLCLHFAAWITSLDYTSVASSVVLLSTTAVFVGIGSIIFLKEKPTLWLMFGILLTLTGSLVISLKEFQLNASSTWGNLLALLGALALAGYFLIGRVLRSRLGTLTYVSHVYSIAALAMLVWVFMLNFEITGYDSETYFLLLAIAFVPQVIGHTSLNWALQYVSAATVSVISLAEPICAPILAFFILEEKITALQFIGGILILTGVSLAIQGESRTTVQAAG